MTENHVTIRYIAYSLACLIIISVFSFIIGFCSTFISMFVSRNIYSDEIYEVKSFNEDMSNVVLSKLSIDLFSSKLDINVGNEFSLKTNNENIKYKIDDETLTIEETGKLFKTFKSNSVLILTIPEDIEFDLVDFDLGFGLTNIENLTINSGKFDLGVGSSNIKNINVKNNVEIDIGVGKLSIENGNINNLDLSIGIGSVSVSSTLNGTSSIDGGIGKFDLNLLNDDDYKISVDKGIGTIKVNEQEMELSSIGNGENKIMIDGGIGSIAIFTK